MQSSADEDRAVVLCRELRLLIDGVSQLRHYVRADALALRLRSLLQHATPAWLLMVRELDLEHLILDLLLWGHRARVVPVNRDVPLVAALA